MSSGGTDCVTLMGTRHQSTSLGSLSEVPIFTVEERAVSSP